MTIKSMTPSELARAILAEVGEDQTRLNMGTWCSVREVKAAEKVICGTTLCIGGWAAHILGYTFDRYGNTDVLIWPEKPDLGWRHISDVVQEALELTNDQANYLFFEAFADEALEILHDIESGLGFPNAKLGSVDADAY